MKPKLKDQPYILILIYSYLLLDILGDEFDSPLIKNIRGQIKTLIFNIEKLDKKVMTGLPIQSKDYAQQVYVHVKDVVENIEIKEILK